MFNFFVSTGKGQEEFLAQELKAISGLQFIEPTRGGVYFKGDIRAAYRVCLWSRIANRVLLPFAKFKAQSTESLYQGIQMIDWSEHFDLDSTFAIDFNSTQSSMTHTQFGAQRVKDAIVDQFRVKTGSRPSVDKEAPDLRINVYCLRDEITVSLDLSGQSLHERGYRQETVRAPIKENLAATLVAISEWEKLAQEGATFFDPMCGSGTITIEAAWVALNRAPGLMRKRFGFEGWKKHPIKIWNEVRDEALSLQKSKLAPARVIGYDSESRVIRVAHSHALSADVETQVHFEKRNFFETDPPDLKGKKGVLVFNPPYGERLGDLEELSDFYKRVGDTLKQKYKGWCAYVLVGNLELAKKIGLQASRRFVLFNGPIECRCLKIELY